MTRLVPLAFALVCLITASPARAAIIDFEKTPGGATPTDNSKLTSSYSVPNGAGTTTVTFGIDTNGNLSIELNAIFEARPGVATQDDSGPRQSYTTAVPGNPGQPDADLSGTGVGGNWLLRNPKTTAEGGEIDFKDNGRALLILYSGVLPTSASGQIWDIDAFPSRDERWQVDAYNSSGALIPGATRLSPFGIDEDNPNSLNGKPWTFSFDNLAEPIAAIRIHYIGNTRPGDGTVGFGFDNFDALAGANAVPEPTSLALFGLGALGLLGYRRLRRR